ncbi:MAG: phosphatase PAP2 family protein [Sphingomonadales bacterium]|nr:phosphatase PAP2 family protein [Sphingomonadales bacterium]
MAVRPYYLAASTALILGWVAILLGFNMPFTWRVHQTYHPGIDDFFIHFSWLAEWLLIIIASSIALIRDWKRGLFVATVLGVQALVVAGIKVAINAPRPIEINPKLVRIIPHLDIHHWQAFPSGHTAVAFFTMGWLALNYPKSSKNPVFVAMSLFIVAAGIGYSRIYLAQHSLIDVCAGGTLALLFLFAAQTLINRLFSRE